MATLEKTEGTILNTDIGSGQSRYRRSSGGYYYRTSYFPDITYRYTVGGREYINNRYAQRPSLINRQGIIQRILDKYPVNSTVTVYYNPDNPQESYLAKGYGKTVTLIVMAVVIIVIVAIAVLFVLFNGMR